MNLDTFGLLAAIGIMKGSPFLPEVRMRPTLAEAAAIGNATARAILFKCHIKEPFYFPDSALFTPFIGGSYEFLQDGIRLLEARTAFFYCAWGVTPAVAMK